ncbi:hypothetical protein HMPREF1544_06047 [Mucor circinelloides 1006PhL]|uniref:Autophagy-related protein 101 n=1 Tax=Mucor circinelloides f. circinelloides (strain 1006PhL) TaxID=1220926 RepID=S2JAE0_MUCC1|nr:hypothetical protein HMPREF1544_06047 [Mucor circinelloides 1006PhL]KAG1089250.1 hypothetical protein G6F42_020028 [Rhizopus arrhizus]
MTTSQQEFSLEMTSLPRDQVKDVLRGLLHSIFFHRLLINVLPRELRVLNTTVSITDSADVENLIEEKIAEFLHNSNSPTQVKQGKVAVLFYEKRLKKNWFQFSKSEEFVCWEQWDITLNLIQPPKSEQEKLKSMRSVENQFTQNLMKILKIVNDYKEHIPSITTTEGNPFPYQIAIQSQSESWNTMIKRMLVTDAPTIEKSTSSPTTHNTANASSSKASSRPSSIRSDRGMS